MRGDFFKLLFERPRKGRFRGHRQKGDRKDEQQWERADYDGSPRRCSTAAGRRKQGKQKGLLQSRWCGFWTAVMGPSGLSCGPNSAPSWIVALFPAPRSTIFYARLSASTRGSCFLLIAAATFVAADARADGLVARLCRPCFQTLNAS
jgi:hypothetical protein